MQISIPNEFGCLPDYVEETVAEIGSARASVRIALCEDASYRQTATLKYSYGGFGGPVRIDSQPHSTYAQARDAGLRELLEHWDTPFASDPASAHRELQALHERIVAQLTQPTLF